MNSILSKLNYPKIVSTITYRILLACDTCCKVCTSPLTLVSSFCCIYFVIYFSSSRYLDYTASDDMMNFSSSRYLDYTASDGMMINEKLIGKNLERSWRDLFEVILRHLSGGTEKNYRNLSQNSRGPDRNYNPTPPEYSSRMLSLHQTDQCFAMTEFML
jgi:hypothetical protein